MYSHHKTLDTHTFTNIVFLIRYKSSWFVHLRAHIHTFEYKHQPWLNVFGEGQMLHSSFWNGVLVIVLDLTILVSFWIWCCCVKCDDIAYPSIHLSIHPSTHQSIHPFIHISVCLSIHLSVSYWSFGVFIRLCMVSGATTSKQCLETSDPLNSHDNMHVWNLQWWEMLSIWRSM